MLTKASACCVTVVIALAAASVLADSKETPPRPDRPGSANAVKPAPSTGAGRPTIDTVGVDESRHTPIHEPKDSYSAQRRRAQAERRALREKLGWSALSPSEKAALKDVAVGNDQIDAEGRNVVNFAWLYTPQASSTSDRVARDIYLNVEGDLVVAGSRTSPDDRILATEVLGTADAAWTENWNRNFGLAGANYARLWSTTADLYGNTYVGGEHSNGNYVLYQFSGVDGTTIGGLTGFGAGGAFGQATGVAVDPIEGFIYVAGRGSGAYSSGFLARHRPDGNRTRDWIVPMPWGGGGNPATTDPIRINRRGEIFVVGFNTSQAAITKFSPLDGSSEWTWIDSNSSFGEAIDLDFDGNPHIVALDGDAIGWKVLKFDRLTGEVQWTRSRSTGNPDDIAVDAEGNVYVSGTPGTSSTYALQKLNPDGSQDWFVQYGTTISGKRLVTLDRLGNPYVAGGYGGGSAGVDVTKFNPANGNTVWQIDDVPVFNGSETNIEASVEGIEVDATGSVYVGGYRAVVQNGAQEFFVIKYTQPYLFIPQVIKSNPIVRVENHSIWAPANTDVNNTFAALADFNFSMFSFKLDILNTLIDPITRVQIVYGAQGNGLVQGGLDFGFNTSSPRIGVKFHSSITGGTFDATLTGELAFYAPPDGGAGSLVVGDRVPLTIVWTPDARSLELIANNAPRITAELRSEVVGDITIRAYVDDTTVGTIIDQQVLPTPNITKMHDKPIIRFDSEEFTIPLNEWYDFRAGDYPQSEFANAQVRLPKLRSTSSYDSADAKLKSTVSEVFAKGRVNLTNIISFYATGGFVPSLTWEDSGTFHDISFYLAFVQAYFRGDIAAEQDLTLELRPYVELDFDEAGAPTRTVQLTRTGSPGSYTYQGTLDPNLAPTLPADGNIEITPTFGMSAVLSNRTGLQFGVYAGFEPVDIDISASAVGIDLLNLNRCIACIEQDLLALLPGDSRVTSALNGGELNLINRTYPEFAFPEEQTLAPIQIVGDPNNQPLLAGASRAFAPMIIYNQRTPPT